MNGHQILLLMVGCMATGRILALIVRQRRALRYYTWPIVQQAILTGIFFGLIALPSRWYITATVLFVFGVLYVYPALLTLAQTARMEAEDLEGAAHMHRLRSRVFYSPADRAAARLTDAGAHLSKEQYEEARERLQPIFADRKRVPPRVYQAALFNLAVTHVNEEQWTQAAATLATFVPPDDDPVATDLAVILEARARAGLGEIDKAKECLDRVEKKDLEEFIRVAEFVDYLGSPEAVFGEFGINLDALPGGNS